VEGCGYEITAHDVWTAHELAARIAHASGRDVELQERMAVLTAAHPDSFVAVALMRRG
jgi:uncharacterized protein YbjT (DUF2867 family)